MGKEVVVLRYGHRPYRDLRVTTHCCLTARALGAQKIIIEGKPDNSLKETVNRVVKNWGGWFGVEFNESWKKAIEQHKKKGFVVVHLTMYGKPVKSEINKIKKEEKVLVIIGSQKVEIGVYRASDYNVSIGKQPHSEIAALAIFLDRLHAGEELEKKFSGAKIILGKKDEKG